MTLVERVASERRAEEMHDKMLAAQDAQGARVPKWRPVSRAEQKQIYDDYVLSLWNAPGPNIDRR